MKKHVRIQIIGNYLDRIRFSLNRAGIYTEDILRAGNPLGFVSLTEANNQNINLFPENIRNNNKKVTQLTIKKNLDEYLSHDESTFRSNVIEHGRTVRYKNTSSYVIICNTSLLNPLYSFKGYLFSGSVTDNEFGKYLKQKGAVNVVSSPCFNNIRKYFDKYIEILLKEYDRNHIILIKTAPSLWYLGDETFKLFNDKICKLRKFIIEADNYFIEKTNCMVVNSFERYLPDRLTEESFLPCAFYPDIAYDGLSEDLVSAIYDIENRPVVPGQEAKNDTLSHKNIYSSKEEEFLQFLIKKNTDGSALSVKDIQYIEEYTESNHIDIDGIAGLFLLAEQAVSHNAFSKIASNLLYNENCSVVAQSFGRVENNKEFLSRYPYFQGSIPDNHGTYIRPANQYILGILPEQDCPFQLIRFSKSAVDETGVMDKGYCCSVHEAEALCKSMKFYVQRAKRGEGNHPVKLQYESEDSFIQSLCVLDYKYLLGNEPFLIGMDSVTAQNFRVRTNLEFLFCEKTRIVRIQNGLTDQITQYLLSKCIQYEGLDVYYDDLPARSANADHLGYELDKVINEDIDKKCFSNILSDELVKRFDGHVTGLADVLFEAGVSQMLAVFNDAVLYKFSGLKKCSRFLYTIKQEHGYENLKYFIRGFGPHLAYYYCVIRPELLLLHYPLRLSQLCRFPGFEDETNSRLQQEMERCAAVGVHIRRGDKVLWWETNKKFFKEAVYNVISIPEYREAKIYVFSDDIPWCRANAEGLGLSQVDKDNLVYVSHNKGDDSFRDMQLLTLCRVIIGHQGGFASMAYALSDKSEMFITPDKRICELFTKIGKGNKYDICLKTAYYSTWQNDMEDDFAKLRRELDSIKNGWSFRLGRIITYLPRNIRAYMKR